MSKVALATAMVQIRGDHAMLPGDMAAAKGQAVRGAQAIQSAVNTALAGLFGAISLGGLASAFGAAIGFQDKLTQSLAIMGDVSDQQRTKMERLARDMAVKYGRSASDLAESYFFLASAGLNVEQQIGALPAVTAFATAGAFNMSQATDLLTDAQSALGMTSKDTQENLMGMVRLSDVLVKGNLLANASVQQFSEALTSGAGASLRSMGKDVEEGVAVLAAFADQGMKSSQAGNQLKILFRDLSRFAAQNAAAFEKNKIKVFDEDGEVRNAADIIADFEKAMGGMSDLQKTQLFKELGIADEGQMAIKTLMGTSDKIRDYEAALRKAGGTTDQVASKQMDSLLVKINKLRAMFSDLAISVLPAVVQTAINIVRPFATLAMWFGRLNDATGGLISEFLAINGALLLISLSLPKVIAGLRIFFATTKALLVGSGWGLIVIAIGLVASGILLATRAARKFSETANVRPIVDQVTLLWKQFKEVGSGILSTVMAVFAPIRDFVVGVATAIGDAWNRNVEKIQRIIVVWGENVKMLATGVGSVFESVAGFIGGIFSKLFGSDLTNSVSGGLGSAIDHVVNFALNFQEWVNAILTNWKLVWDALPQLALAGLSFVIDVFINAFTQVIPQAIGFGMRKALDFIIVFAKKAIELFLMVVAGLIDVAMDIPKLLAQVAAAGAGPAVDIVKQAATGAMAIPDNFMKGFGGEAPELGDLFKASDRTRDAAAGVQPVFDAIAQSKRDLEAKRGDVFRPGAPPGAGGGGGGAGGGGGGGGVPAVTLKIDPGFIGFQELGKSIQEQFLKGPQSAEEKMVGLAEKNLKIQEKMLDGQKKLIDKKDGGGGGLAPDEEAP